MYELLVVGIAIGFAFGLIIAARYIRRIARGDPTVWEREVSKFRKHDELNPPNPGMIVFTGSSSIRYWKTLKEDLAPLPVLNRGFGGSRIPDVIHYAQEFVISYQPKGVVFYAGENDITGLILSRKHTAEEVRDNFRTFCELIQREYPSIPIFFISVKPPKRRKKFWAIMKEANQLIKSYCDTSESLHYIDIVTPMLNSEGQVNPALFRWDGIHMNDEGYRIWTSVIKPILIAIYE
ncbi:MAG: GDSL-type esterase/lipase family protein [Candidatus Thorarchaeota archaeon]